jgi:hypothetical protein
MIAARLLDKPVFLRELLPQDLKLEIPQLTREEAMKAARYLAIVVGEAHARKGAGAPCCPGDPVFDRQYTSL